MNVERPRRYKLLIIAVIAAAIVASASVAFLYLAIPRAPIGIETSPVDVTIANSAFQPSQLELTIGHNNTILFVDGATNPPLVKLASESPWPAGFQPFIRGLTLGQNYTVTLNVPGTYHVVDDESMAQGNLTIVVTA